MRTTALRVVQPVDAPETIIRPKFLSAISDEATLKDIFVYSQRDFSLGASVHERSRAYDPNIPPLPEHTDRTLVDLGGGFTAKELRTALHAQKENEDPKITALRETIVAEIEHKKLFYGAVKTPEDAHKHGVVFTRDFPSPGDDPFEKGVAIGVLAYER